jgi:hypothetical protein
MTRTCMQCNEKLEHHSNDAMLYCLKCAKQLEQDSIALKMVGVIEPRRWEQIWGPR